MYVFLKNVMYASSPGQQLFKFIRTEQSFYKRRRFNSHRTGVEHQRGRLFIFWDTNIAAVTSCENALL